MPSLQHQLLDANQWFTYRIIYRFYRTFVIRFQRNSNLRCFPFIVNHSLIIIRIWLLVKYHCLMILRSFSLLNHGWKNHESNQNNQWALPNIYQNRVTCPLIDTTWSLIKYKKTSLWLKVETALYSEVNYLFNYASLVKLYHMQLDYLEMHKLYSLKRLSQ